jgi:hypothetical protein
MSRSDPGRVPPLSEEFLLSTPFSGRRDAHETHETLDLLATSKGHIMNRHPRSFDTMTLLQTAPVVLLAIWVLTVIFRSV